jgi:hypothetical protein
LSPLAIGADNPALSDQTSQVPQAGTEPGYVHLTVGIESRGLKTHCAGVSAVTERPKEAIEVDTTFAWVQVAASSVGVEGLAVVVLDVDVRYTAVLPEPTGFQRGFYLIVLRKELGIERDCTPGVCLQGVAHVGQGIGTGAWHGLYCESYVVALGYVEAGGQRCHVALDVAIGLGEAPQVEHYHARPNAIREPAVGIEHLQRRPYLTLVQAGQAPVDVLFGVQHGKAQAGPQQVGGYCVEPAMPLRIKHDFYAVYLQLRAVAKDSRVVGEVGVAAKGA